MTEPKRTEQALEERLRFERLLSELSARFVNILPDRVDYKINYGLRQFLEFFRVDRCALIRTLHGRTAWQITHVATSDDLALPAPVGAVLPRAIHPWAMEMLFEKKQIQTFSSLRCAPPRGPRIQADLDRVGTRSTLNIPILIGESVDYAISINSVKSERVWPEEFVPRLRLLGEIFVNALERKQMTREIQKSAEEWQTTFDSVRDLVMILDQRIQNCAGECRNPFFLQPAFGKGPWKPLPCLDAWYK